MKKVLIVSLFIIITLKGNSQFFNDFTERAICEQKETYKLSGRIGYPANFPYLYSDDNLILLNKVKKITTTSVNSVGYGQNYKVEDSFRRDGQLYHNKISAGGIETLSKQIFFNDDNLKISEICRVMQKGMKAIINKYFFFYENDNHCPYKIKYCDSDCFEYNATITALIDRTKAQSVSYSIIDSSKQYKGTVVKYHYDEQNNINYISYDLEYISGKHKGWTNEYWVHDGLSSTFHRDSIATFKLETDIDKRVIRAELLYPSTEFYKYKYNKKNQVIKIIRTSPYNKNIRRIKYTYYENGLLKSTSYFPKSKTTTPKIIYKYEYYE